MSTNADIWLAFARTLGMLLVVLGFFLVVFWVFRRISASTGVKGAKNLIQVLGVHHVSPKEKLMLVKVLEENILIGVTPQSITPLAQLGRREVQPEVLSRPGFSDVLKTSLSASSLAAFAKKGQTAAGEEPAEGDASA